MTTDESLRAEIFESHRRRLLNVAYGMLGVVAEAEDVVQVTYLRWAATDWATIDSPGAWLTTVTTRIAIDRLRSAQRRRETYVGPWLPEPLVTEFVADPAEVVADAEQLSLALLTAMERLTPTERAVLLLREVFDFDYAEIADVVDKSPANCRQIASRARSHIGEPNRVVRHDPAAEQRLLASYVQAISDGDVERLAAVFADDVVLWADGGGKVRAARHPLHGAARVARHLIGVRDQVPPDVRIEMVRANGDPALAAFDGDRPIGVVALEVQDGLAVAVRAVINPEKLRNLL